MGQGTPGTPHSRRRHRQRSEGRRLASYRRRLRQLIGARTGDALYVLGPDYTIVHWDPNMESLSGVLSDEALGRTCCEAVMGEAEEGRPFCAHGCSVMHLAQEGRPVSSYEMRIKTRSGARRWVSASNLTIETEEGPFLVHLLRDTQGTHDTLEMARGLIRLSSKEDAPAPARKDAPALTPRQLEILKLLSEGKSAREIGRELYLSQATVRNHIRALLQALGAHSQLEVLAKARELGLL
jgi:PAS domain S-box-containing protein